MRDFRVQTLVNCIKILKQKEMSFGDLVSYIWLWIRPTGSSKVSANQIFDLKDITTLRPLLMNLGGSDPAWFPRLFEPTTLGIRSWEYGVLLSKTKFKNKTVLDVGSGNSRFPQYLARSGAKVTMLDMESPLEETVLKQDKDLRFVLGDMTNLKFKDKSFERVVCISAIEHVDMKDGGKYYSSKEYFNRAKKAIREIARVTKKGGILFITTDFYLPRQTTDKWPHSTDQIRGAFPWDQIEVFVKEMEKSGIRLSSKPEYDKNLLLSDKNRANYRGRYFSTFAFMGTKI